MGGEVRRVLLLPGDGIGPEVVGAAREVLEAASSAFDLELAFEEGEIGAAAIRSSGEPLPEETARLARESDAVLLGAVGHPDFDGAEVRPEAGLLALRRELGVFANLRPVSALPSLLSSSPLKPELVEGVDLLIVRELTGGIYFGEKEEGTERASDLCLYSREEVERVARVAFEAARLRKGRVTSVDKANVLATSRMWRRVVAEVAKEYPDVELDNLLVDAAAMFLVREPSRFDVILTENMFGDILSDEAAMLTGSLGMLPSASLGDPGRPGLFEPVHGSAPDIAGQGIANPLAMLGSVVLMLRHGLAMEDAAARLQSAIERALEEGLRTRDLGGSATTEEATQAVLAHL